MSTDREAVGTAKDVELADSPLGRSGVPPYLTIQELASELNLPLRLLNRLRAIGVVRGYRFGHRSVRFLAPEVQEQLRRFREVG